MWKNPLKSHKNLQKLNKSYVNNPSMILFNFFDFLCILEDFLQKQFSLCSDQRPYFFKNPPMAEIIMKININITHSI